MEMKGKRDQNGINMSALDNTELIPENMSQIKNPTSPTKFTERLQNGEALRMGPQGISLLKTLGFDAQEEGNLEPDFYMPDGKGSKLSEILAGAWDRDRSEPQPSIQVSKIQATPAAESTRIPLRTSTDKHRGE